MSMGLPQVCGRYLLWLILLGAWGWSPTGAEESPPEQWSWLQLEDQRLHVIVADHHERREQGLQDVAHLEENAGLLMIYARPQVIRLWMKDTLIPLDAGFFDDAGRLMEIVRMWPDGGRQVHQSSRPATYVLEVNRGWFDRHRILPGRR